LNAFGAGITVQISHLFTKTSIVVFYLRFSTSRAFNWTAYAVIFLICGHNLVGATGVLYSCRPISYFWTFEGKKHWCIDRNAWYGTMTGLNVLEDVVLLLLPIWLIKPLSVDFGQRIAIAAMLGAGGL